MHQHLRYRAHIDGLRAIAVVGVVLFHFGAEWLPGGFVGVDVFFVISGFLIAKSIYRETGEGSFSLIAFYERRARRIVPAFAVVTLATSIAAGLILFPGQLTDYATSLVWSSLFAANIYFYRTSDYFGPSADELPLLHYWSLGVEEQFYIVFPLLVLALQRLAPRFLPAVLSVLLVASLARSQWMLGRNADAAFYLPQYRAFELLIGALLALPGMRFPSDRRLAGGSVVVGLGLILASMALFTGQTPFPGLWALVPCLGTALVIWGGDRVPSLPSTLLGAFPLGMVGRISYSVYLVHWPLVVFTRMLAPDIPPPVFLAGGTVASLTLGWLCWRLVEQPPRARLRLFPRWAIFLFTAASIALFVTAGDYVRTAKGFPGRQKEDVQRMLATLRYDLKEGFRQGTCFLLKEQKAEELDVSCLPQSGPRVVLIGSSNVAEFSAFLVSALTPRGYAVGQITGSGCIPFYNYDNPKRPNCQSLMNFGIDWVLANKPEVVVMGGDQLVGASSIALFDETAQKFAQAGIQVVVIGPMPYYKKAVPSILAGRLLQESHDTRSLDQLVPAVEKAESAMSAYYAKFPYVRYVSIAKTFCPDYQCPMAIEGKPLQFDVTHVTKEGAAYFGTAILDAIPNPR